jgi:hypothetical protein
VSLTAQKRARVRRRARQICEYCQLPERASILPHQVDHIISQQHGGTDHDSNLCLSCLHCNLKKGPNIASTDPETGNEHNLIPLFHPRKQRWQDHFHLQGDGRIVGKTPEGRATATLLNFNEEHRLQLRRALMQQDWSP